MGSSLGCSQCVASREHEGPTTRCTDNPWSKSSSTVNATDMNLVHDCDGNRQVHAASPPAVTCRSRTRQHIESPRVPSAVANSEEKLQELQVLMELPDGTLLEADRLATGNGILRHANGSFYDGQWSAGQATGFGRFTHTDGSTYEGQWRGNQQGGTGGSAASTRRCCRHRRLEHLTVKVTSGRADVLVPRNATPGLTKVVMKAQTHSEDALGEDALEGTDALGGADALRRRIAKTHWVAQTHCDDTLCNKGIPALCTQAHVMHCSPEVRV
eukprot:s3058_g17.t1